MTLVDNFGAEGGLGGADEVLCVVGIYGKRVGNGVKVLQCVLTSHLESVSDPKQNELSAKSSK